MNGELRGLPRDNCRRRKTKRPSRRRQAMMLFAHDVDPAVVAVDLGLPPATCRRYYEIWKQKPQRAEAYVAAHKIYERMTEREKIQLSRILAAIIGARSADVLELLRRPWGLRRLVLEDPYRLLPPGNVPTMDRIVAAFVRRSPTTSHNVQTVLDMILPRRLRKTQ